MAKYDVYRDLRGALLLDCQANLLDGLATRLVVPLLPAERAPRPADRLNPLLQFGGDRFVMMTHFAAAIPLRECGARVGSLLSEQDRINVALDMLITGF